jgi:hypothetical protein
MIQCLVGLSNQNAVDDQFTRLRLHDAAFRAGRVSLLSRDSPVMPGGPPRSRDYMFAPGGRHRHARHMTSSNLVKQTVPWGSGGEISRHSSRAKGRLAGEARSGAFCSRNRLPKRSLACSEQPEVSTEAGGGNASAKPGASAQGGSAGSLRTGPSGMGSMIHPTIISGVRMFSSRVFVYSECPDSLLFVARSRQR